MPGEREMSHHWAVTALDLRACESFVSVRLTSHGLPGHRVGLPKPLVTRTHMDASFVRWTYSYDPSSQDTSRAALVGQLASETRDKGGVTTHMSHRRFGDSTVAN